MGEVSEHILERLVLKIRADAEDLGQRMASELQKLVAAGVDEAGLLAFLRRDIAVGGPLLGMIRNTMVSGLAGAVGEIQQEAVREQFPDDQEWTWVDVQDDRECDDCEARHGMTKTWDEWVAIGLPGVGATRCRYRCRCELIPRGEVGKDPDLLQPVKVKTVAEYREEYARRS